MAARPPPGGGGDNGGAGNSQCDGCRAVGGTLTHLLMRPYQLRPRCGGKQVLLALQRVGHRRPGLLTALVVPKLIIICDRQVDSRQHQPTHPACAASSALGAVHRATGMASSVDLYGMKPVHLERHHAVSRLAKTVSEWAGK